MCCTVVGDVIRPGVVETEFGTPLVDVIERCGGVADGRSVRAVLSGVSNAVITGDKLDTPVSYEGFESIGSGLGSAGFIVYDDTTCMVEVAAMLSRFLSVESCGQCSACKLGTAAITDSLDRIIAAAGTELEFAGIHRATAYRHRRQPMLPAGRGAATRLQSSRRLPRGLRRPPPHRPMSATTRAADPQDRRHRQRRGDLRRRPVAKARRLDVLRTLSDLGGAGRGWRADDCRASRHRGSGGTGGGSRNAYRARRTSHRRASRRSCWRSTSGSRP